MRLTDAQVAALAVGTDHIARLAADMQAARAVLRELEWAGTSAFCGAAECPLCGEERGGGDTPTGTHRSTCRLAALL